LKRTILVGRADIVIWRSRYLKEVQEYGDNEHLMFYMHKTWTDSNFANVGKNVKSKASILM